MGLLLIFLPFLFIIAWPYRLHFESQRLAQPVVVFKANFWRAMPWTIPFLGLACFIVGIAFHLINQPNAGLGTLIMALPGLALGYILLRLHLSYWQHDQYATLTIYPQEQRAEYCNEDVQLSFALADVMHIVEYTTTARSSRGQPWSHYSYRVFFLRDGTQLLITCLLYSLLGLQELFPATSHDTMNQFICWLPGNEAGARPLY